MLSDIKRHKFAYSLLALMATGFTVYFLLHRHDPNRLLLSTAIFSAAYFLWGVGHHLQLHHLTARLVLEYFLVAVLGITLVSTLLL